MDEQDIKGEELGRLPFFGLPRIMPYIKQYRPTLILIALTVLVTSSVDIIMPLFQKYAIDDLITDGKYEGLTAFIIAFVAASVIQTLATVTWLRLCCETEVFVSRDLKKQAFRHLQTLSFSYFNKNSVGYIHSRVMSDPSKIGMIFAWGLIDVYFAVFYIVGSIIVMFTLDAKLALLSVIIIPIAGVAAYFFERRLTEGNKRVREINSRITSAINEGITGVKTTKALTVEDKMCGGFSVLTERMRRASAKVAGYKGLFISVVVFCSYVTVALVLWYGGTLTHEGLMKIGTLSVFTTYAISMTDPIQQLSGTLAEAYAIKVNIGRLVKLLETQPDVTDSPEVIEKYGDDFNPKTENWEDIRGDIEFKNVDFKYPDGDEYILENFNLKVPAKTTVAIVGETGAGKSTLVNLVCRFFEPTRGEILIDGVDYRERSQHWLHSHLGYVLQTPHLFSGSVRENLEYGIRGRKASDEELMAAVRAVSAKQVIARMENGLDSPVGEGGGMLSTGEKQLISFARAVLCDPAIFILDEATSSVDTMTEKAITDATAALLHGRTSFIIAHRLSTIRQADIIIVVSDGKIVEMGSHDELMAKNGAYRGLYIKQFEEEQAART